MGPSRKFSKTRILEKSGKVTCLAIRKALKNTHVFQRRPLDCTQIKIICHSNNQNTIRIFLFLVADSYGWCCSLIHMIDIFCKITQIKSFSSSSFLCLPMKVYESEVYAKHIVQSWEMHCACPIRSYLSLDVLVVTKIFPKFFKRFQNPPATHEIKL